MENVGKEFIDAIVLIKKKFEDKVDKGGKPYINHLFSVSNKIKKLVDDLALWSDEVNDVVLFYQKCSVVALLHDILEDTNTTAAELKDNGFSDDIIDAVVAITRRKDEKSYIDYIDRLKSNDMAKCVKIYDLEDNMNITRLQNIDDSDLKRIKKYFYCHKYLHGLITKEELINKLK